MSLLTGGFEEEENDSESKYLVTQFNRHSNQLGENMTEAQSAPNVGAPDPELKNSPIFDGSEKAASLDQELETGVCYFNNEAFDIDSYVCSGNELLRCEGRGIWVREGACYTDESE